MNDGSVVVRHDLVDSLCEKVEEAVLRREPFPHIVVDDVLPEDIFARLVADLPGTDELTPLSRMGWQSGSQYDGHATAQLNELVRRRDRPAWTAVEAALLHPDCEAALRRMFGHWAGEVPADRPLHKQVRIDRNEAGAYLLPHTDTPAAYVKTLIYLDARAADPSLGTVLYEPRDPVARAAGLGPDGDYTPANYAHERIEDHREVGRVAFRPNRLFAFVRTSFSLHGLSPLSASAAPRYLISGHFKRS